MLFTQLIPVTRSSFVLEASMSAGTVLPEPVLATCGRRSAIEAAFCIREAELQRIAPLVAQVPSVSELNFRREQYDDRSSRLARS